MKKATHETDRKTIQKFQQIINVGPAIERDFLRLGLTKPQDLKGKSPWSLYTKISELDGAMHDPCVLDVYIASVNFMNGDPPEVWWAFTDHRKEKFGKKIERLRTRFNEAN